MQSFLLKNRVNKISQASIENRYLPIPPCPQPIIIWMHINGGEPIGMASLIFRPYRVNSELCCLANLSDISLNHEYRNKGLGRKLFEFVNQTIDNLPNTCGFVIPNMAAQKSLSHTGWKTNESLIPYSMPLNITPWIRILRKVKFLEWSINKGITSSLQFYLRCRTKLEIAIEQVPIIDTDFDIFWKSFDQRNVIIGEKNKKSLSLKYENSERNFKIYKLKQDNDQIGFIICSNSEDNKCYIYEFLVKHELFILPSIYSLVKLFLQDKIHPMNLRITINEHHPYAKQLSKAGFFKRKPEGAFQTYIPPGILGNSNDRWMITSGDKEC